MADVTLAEFVLARIAEDKAVALAELARRTSEKWAPGHEPEGDDFDIRGGCDCRYPQVVIGIERMLAECEAKWRIVRGLGMVSPGPDSPAVRYVLPLLALPYAARPDYRSEWRP